MRLNTIQISGFKSFPERSELSFDGGVTAIVGPNGCGKSNVIDAISWALGEQSARSLRGERMEDIIFSGSDARRPTATAEVRLQLSQVTAALAVLEREHPARTGRLGDGNGHGGDGNGHGPGAGDATVATRSVEPVDDDVDTDSDEVPTIACDVEVGRRLYRSGESEYLIDGQVCRLRDIQDLLMDSGVGVKAYAVIEQGKIGQILGARPTERRQLLEEAAGVTKYKTRRRSAELKLEAAQQNLTRVDDIVFEVESQRASLKRQAAKARRYRRLRAELRRWEKVQFARKSVSLTGIIEMAAQRLEEARQREQGAAGGLAALEGTHEQLQIELAEAERGATQARDAAHAHELEMGRRQQQIEFDKQQVVTLTAAEADGETELGQLKEKQAPLQSEYRDQTAASDACDIEQADSETRLRRAEVQHEEAQRAIEGLEGDVEASRSEVFAAINAATTLQHVADNAATARGRISDELAKLSAEGEDVETETSKVASDREHTARKITRVREGLEAVRLKRADREVELASVRAARESRADEVRTREHALASRVARLRSIEELIAAREGYSDAARLVLLHSKESLTHLGSVADHLDADRHYERAVEASLGELVQYIVVPSEQDARAGMALAASENAGRCGFVIVDAAPATEFEATPDPALTPLAQLVRIDGDAGPALRGLLRRRWFATSVDAAAAASRTTDDPITTPDGTVFRGSSVVHGGGKAEALGILATKGETRELRSKMTEEEEQLKRLDAEVTRYGSIAVRAEAELKTLQAEEHSTEKALLELELRGEGLNEELARLRQKHEVVDTEHRKAVEERDGLDARKAEATEAISRLELEQRDADERFMRSQRHLLEAREAVETFGERVTEAKATHAALAERAGALAADVRRLSESAQDLGQRIATRTADNGQIVERRQTLVATIAASEQRLDNDNRRFESLRDEVRSGDERTDEVRHRIESQVDEFRAARETLELIRHEVGELDIRRATAQADHVHLESACRETLQLSLGEVCTEVDQLERDGALMSDATLGSPRPQADAKEADGFDDDADADDDDGGVEDDQITQAHVAGESVDQDVPVSQPTSAVALTAEDVITTLREKIDRLGPVNMMAIDQFDELDDRFEFLTTQRKDLLDSIQATGEAIKRIDVTTRERFKEAFTAVNGHFQEIFSTLFGGGRAGLVLLDDSDLLESGVDIIAQPPGKRLQSIQLLSGGEKALTAMALMFAIFKFKPSPFCLLDEIDAPLDDANVGRFVEMLRGMQDRTQFVLVTHNRKTMEIADRLYGVTMEEPGVSKLISVKLT